MITLEIGGKEYNLAYGMNITVETDLIDKVTEIVESMSGNGKVKPEDINGATILKEFGATLRSLFYYGCKKHNALLNENVAGDLIDEYLDEDENNTVAGLFGMIIEELTTKGFMSHLLVNLTPQAEEEQKPKKSNK